MNYFEWADEYYQNARTVLAMIERLKSEMNDAKLTADMRKQLADQILQYRRILYEQREIGDILYARAQRYADEA